ncbi:hypothetical protein H696_04310 [Fonticula alba]|uniref:Uncharacterized protein n=1 Tax=Fonticula alba TaxID=691883 RepID=A0A058Z5U6_FONAL|nr:hypothetical protein H696_04310 [Fonticula alba]KCV68892.1 hypothetical protein H696_04310 [Fonticula alba]|eukprot:XP_009496463.1 hypothetical protein H696_04310 [Fonticula alba]
MATAGVPTEPAPPATDPISDNGSDFSSDGEDFCDADELPDLPDGAEVEEKQELDVQAMLPLSEFWQADVMASVNVAVSRFMKADDWDGAQQMLLTQCDPLGP